MGGSVGSNQQGVLQPHSVQLLAMFEGHPLIDGRGGPQSNNGAAFTLNFRGDMHRFSSFDAAFCAASDRYERLHQIVLGLLEAAFPCASSNLKALHDLASVIYFLSMQPKFIDVLMWVTWAIL